MVVMSYKRSAVAGGGASVIACSNQSLELQQVLSGPRITGPGISERYAMHNQVRSNNITVGTAEDSKAVGIVTS